MPLLARGLVTFTLLAVLAFCVLGFIATAETPGFPLMEVIYGVAGAACLATIVWVWTRRTRKD